MRKFITEFKYSGAYVNLESITPLLKPKLKKFIRQIHLKHPNKKPVFIPIPIYWHKKIKRGFNQTEMIANLIPEIAIKNILIKAKSSKHQAGKDRDKRLKAKFKFTISQRVKLNENEIPILLDDVLTTGSTLKSAAKVVKRAYPKRTIYAIALFRPSYRGSSVIIPI